MWITIAIFFHIIKWFFKHSANFLYVKYLFQLENIKIYSKISKRICKVLKSEGAITNKFLLFCKCSINPYWFVINFSNDYSCMSLHKRRSLINFYTFKTIVQWNETKFLRFWIEEYSFKFISIPIPFVSMYRIWKSTLPGFLQELRYYCIKLIQINISWNHNCIKIEDFLILEFIDWLRLAIVEKKNISKVGGLSKKLRNFQKGSCKMLTSAYKVGGWGEKGQKYAYVIFEWSLSQ